ncbi:MAG: excinuclease ABC subunit UvrC [Clostridiales bacterium]|nr:excinuclease ABC subunit UvrC [Clostridiales bacterium]
MTLAELRKKAMALPQQPGVYIMKNKDKKIIYIGKAKKLKNRVSSYFISNKSHSAKVIKMVQNVDDFDYILVDTEFEALVLECSLIKQHMPKYNILLKDDKGYRYIKISAGEFPKISEAKRIENDGAEYIGPYVSNFSVKQALDETLKIFKLPRCSKKFPRDWGKSRMCLNGFMGLCSAPCAGRISKEEYANNITAARSFLKGGSKTAVAELTEKMNEYSRELLFEDAAKTRDTIKAIKNLEETQKVVSVNYPDEDVFSIVNSNSKACFEVLRFENNRLTDSEFWLIDPVFDMPGARFELLERYYSLRGRVPSRIVTDGDIQDEELLKQFLESMRGKKVEFFYPQRGEQLKILNMCIKNANEHLAQNQGRLGKELAALKELADLLGLKNAPEYIESYDISHTAGADNVAGMVVFQNGRPLKSAYKRFSIKGFEGQNDVGSMNEVLRRRFEHYLNDGENSTFKTLPDLILLDGAAAQVNAVIPVLKSFSLDIPVFGMVKDSKHRTRAIAATGGEIQINSNRQAFTLVSSIQEEVHRFSVAYHHAKHKKSSFSSSLMQISGIGEKKAKALLKHFKTITAIKGAAVQQLQQCPGISLQNANDIYDFYHNS